MSIYISLWTFWMLLVVLCLAQLRHADMIKGKGETISSYLYPKWIAHYGMKWLFHMPNLSTYCKKYRIMHKWQKTKEFKPPVIIIYAAYEWFPTHVCLTQSFHHISECHSPLTRSPYSTDALIIWDAMQWKNAMYSISLMCDMAVNISTGRHFSPAWRWLELLHLNLSKY